MCSMSCRAPVEDAARHAGSFCGQLIEIYRIVDRFILEMNFQNCFAIAAFWQHDIGASIETAGTK